MKDEIQRRASLKDRIEALFRSRPGEWISITELADIGGVGGWRTRKCELENRKIDPMHIEHNGLNGAASAHRFLPHTPLGRDASVPAPDRWPSFGPYTDTFTLTPPEAR